MAQGDAEHRLPVTVVIPTLGRTELLSECLRSLHDCEPLPSEVIVVDGSGKTDVSALLSEFSSIHLRRIEEDRRGAASAANLGLRAAANNTVLFTHDDCVVASDWVANGARLLEQYPRSIVTGAVLPIGDPRGVPGLAVSAVPQDYTGTRARVLLAHNMGCSREALLEFGGFDERMRPVAEDDDLAFRWLRAGRTLRYRPELMVWHTAWRTDQELRRVYRVYAQGDGMVYTKHLLAGDLVMLKYILSDVCGAILAEARAAMLGKRRAWDHRLGAIPNLLIGIRRGLRIFGRARGYF